MPKTRASSYVLTAIAMALLLGASPCNGSPAEVAASLAWPLRLKSEFFPTPIKIPGDVEDSKITSLVISADRFPLKAAEGTLLLRTNRLQFDSFGNATPMDDGTPGTVQITFSPVKLPEPQTQLGVVGSLPHEDRQLFEVVCKDGRFRGQIFLVLGSDAGHRHRLLIYKQPQEPTKFGQLAHRIELQGIPVLKDSLPAHAIGTVVQGRNYFHDRNGLLKSLSVHGDLNGEMHITFDLNTIGFDLLGDAGITTAALFKPIACKPRRIDEADPAGSDRRLYELTPERVSEQFPPPYRLVVPATDAEPLRLLIHAQGKLAWSVPLYNYNREYQLSIQRDLAYLSPQERRAVEQLRTLAGHRFHVTIKADAVHHLRLYGDYELGALAPVISSLACLEHLQFNGGILSNNARIGLQTMPPLTSLSFSGTHLSSAALASLLKATPRLQWLSFIDCRGVTDAALSSIGELSTLTYLRITRDQPIQGEYNMAAITDDGIAKLKSLNKLEELLLSGCALADPSMASITSLPQLKRLYVSGEGISDKGLLSLADHPTLTGLDLYQTSTTTEGRAKLTELNPRIQVRGN